MDLSGDGGIGIFSYSVYFCQDAYKRYLEENLLERFNLISQFKLTGKVQIILRWTGCSFGISTPNCNDDR